MRICFVSREYPPETGWGGIGSYTYEVAHGLTSLGHEVHVIAYSPEGEREYFDKLVKVHRIPLKISNGFWRLENWMPINQLFYSSQVAQKINQLIRKERIELVECPEMGFEAFFYSFAQRIPVVIKFHTPQFILNKLANIQPDFKNRSICYLEKQTSKRFRFYASPSRMMAREIAGKFKLPEHTIEVIPLPINTRIFSPAKEEEAKKGFTIVYSGRLERRKGVHVLAQAIPEILKVFPETKFLLIGKDTQTILNGGQMGSMQNYVEKIAGKNNVHFLGYVKREELIKHYRQSTLCVMPSLWENFGYAALEAMACGKPVIVSQTSGIAEFVDHTALVKIPENDSKALSQAVIRLLKNPAERISFGQKARQAVEARFDSVKVSQGIAEHYQSILRTGR